MSGSRITFFITVLLIIVVGAGVGALLYVSLPQQKTTPLVSAPQNVTFSDPTVLHSRDLTITWDASSDAQSYTITCSDGTGLEGLLSPQWTYKDYQLRSSPGDVLVFNIRAIGSNSTTASTTANFTVPTLAAATGLAVTFPQRVNALITWNVVLGAEGYRVMSSTDINATPAAIAGDIAYTNSGASYSIPRYPYLLPGASSVTFSVYAIDVYNRNGFVASTGALTLPSVPTIAAPANFTSTVDDTGAIIFSWTASPGASSYSLNIEAAGISILQTYTTTTTLVVPINALRSVGVVSGDSVSCFCVALDPTSLDSAISSISTISLAARLASPSGLSVSFSPSNDLASLSWTPTPGATTYSITCFNATSNVSIALPSTSTSTNTLLIPQLMSTCAAFDTLRFSVTAVDATGAFRDSNPVLVSTSVPLANASVNGITIANTSGDLYVAFASPHSNDPNVNYSVGLCSIDAAGTISDPAISAVLATSPALIPNPLVASRMAVRVKTTHTNGNSIVFTTDAKQVPLQLLSTAATSTSLTSVKVIIQQQDATSQQVSYGLINDKKLGSFAAAPASGQSVSWIAENLVQGTPYTFTVISCSPFGALYTSLPSVTPIAPPSISAAGTMTVGRVDAFSISFTNGDVLVCGGTDAVGTHYKSTDRFVLSTKSFVPGPGLKVARSGALVIQLTDTTWCVIGGWTNDDVRVQAVEVYDSVANTFTVSTSISLPSGVPFATNVLGDSMCLLANGDVILMPDDTSGIPYLFSVTTQTCISLPLALSFPRAQCRMSLVQGDFVLFTGGVSVAPTTPAQYLPCELLDVTLQSLTVLASSSNVRRASHTVVYVPTTSTWVLCGGVDAQSSQTLGTYDTLRFTSADLSSLALTQDVAAMYAPRSNGHTSFLSGQGVTTCGGLTSTSSSTGVTTTAGVADTEILDMSTLVATSENVLQKPARSNAVVLFQPSRSMALCIGGMDAVSGQVLNDAEYFWV